MIKVGIKYRVRPSRNRAFDPLCVGMGLGFPGKDRAKREPEEDKKPRGKKCETEGCKIRTVTKVCAVCQVLKRAEEKYNRWMERRQ